MRPELNEIQYIEFYLQGKLDQNQKIEFEQKMISDEAFKEKVELQKQLMQGIENRALRTTIAKAYSKFKFNKSLKWGFVGAVIFIATIAVVFVTLSKVEGSAENWQDSLIQGEADELGISTEKLAGNSITSQVFNIQGDQDTVIQTKDGIVFAIEAGSFVDQAGSPVEGSIQIVVKEALKIEDILSSGLSTVTSTGEQLETGGMFSVNATSDNKALNIDPDKGIFTQVPTDEKKSGMKLWKGVYQKNGELLWEEPKELEKFLIPVDMSLLNFYPKDFESNLERLGFPGATKKEKDSVYYSFGSHFTKKGREQFEAKHINDQVVNGYYRYPIKTGLNPAKVKTFWNEKFNGSLLATKEFEKRMHLIHQTGSDDILDLYIKNAGKRISDIDAMAAEQALGKLKKRFEEYAALDEGRVETNPQLVKMMNNFYRQKELSYKQALSKANKFWIEQKRKDKEAANLNRKFNENEGKRVFENFKKEFQDNLDTVYKQLGYKSGPIVTYNVRVTSVGWNNIDKKVFDATVTRSSMSVTENGKTAKLSYSELQLLQNKKFDRVYAYVLTPSLPSFQRMMDVESGMQFSFKLNDFYRYGLAVIGYKGDSSFTYFEPQIKSDSVYSTSGDSVRIKSVELKNSSEKEFFKQVNQFTKSKGFKGDLKKDLLYQKFFHQEEKRQMKLQEMINFRREMQEYVFPVYYLSMDMYYRKIDFEKISANYKLPNASEDWGVKSSLIAIRKSLDEKDERSWDYFSFYDDCEEVILDKNGRTLFSGERREAWFNEYKLYGDWNMGTIGVHDRIDKSLISYWKSVKNHTYIHFFNENSNEDFVCIESDFELLAFPELVSEADTISIDSIAK